MSYKALFIDFYGTLATEDDLVIAEIVQAIADQSPLSSDKKQIGQEWGRHFQSRCASCFGNTFKTQREIELESLEFIFKKYHAQLSVRDASEKLFLHWQAPQPFADVGPFLQKNALPICIVSNIDTVDLQQAINNAGWSFKDLVTSEQCRSYKPRPEMFERALQTLDCQPDEVLHIGDSFASDVTGAHKLGIATAWMNRKNKPLPGRTPQPTIVVNNFDQLLAQL